MLDAAGFEDMQIMASNSLDEYLVRDLLVQGARVDSFGIGERLITSKSEPVFGGVYKLAAVEDENGEIIPKIVGVDVEARGLLVGDKVRFIRSCPECGTPLMRPEGEAAHYCPNEAGCPPQIKGKIEHFVTRRAMNINMGPETVEDLYEAGYIKDTADLYTLEIADLLRLERWADKSARNLMASLEESQTGSLRTGTLWIGDSFCG